MHAIFIPYGKMQWMDTLKGELMAQKHLLKLTKGKEEKQMWIDGQLRMLPFGVWDYVFPKEDMDAVLTGLQFHTGTDYGVGKWKVTALRKGLGAEKIPKFNTDKSYLFHKEFVYIVPIGVKYDDDIVDPSPGEWNGWTHEGI